MRFVPIIHGRKFDRYYWRGKIFSVRRQQAVSWVAAVKWVSEDEVSRLYDPHPQESDDGRG